MIPGLEDAETPVFTGFGDPLVTNPHDGHPEKGR